MKNSDNINILSERLKQVLISEEYINDIFNNFTKDITEYMIPQPSGNIQDTIDFVKNSIEENKNGSNLQLVILDRESNEFLGCSGLHSLKSNSPALGIWLKKSAHKKSYGYEAITAIINWTKENRAYKSLIYPVDRDNYPSKQIPLRHNGILKKEYQCKNFNEDILNISEYEIILK